MIHKVVELSLVLLTLRWSEVVALVLVEVEGWNENTITFLKIDHFPSCAIEMWVELFLGHEKVDRGDVVLVVFGFATALAVVIWCLNETLASINLLSIDMRHQDDIHIAISKAHDLLFPLVMRPIDEMGALNEFDAFKFSDVVVESWEVYLTENLLQETIISSFVF